MRPLSSVKKALNVLETFIVIQPELVVTKISRILNSNKTSIYKILFTLMSQGFVGEDPQWKVIQECFQAAYIT
jgi:DNA-binding IclR family transcriptional regulator